MKVKASIAKKQLIFLERCIKNNILPKSFRLEPPIKSNKGYNMKDCRKKIVVLAKNNAKQRMYFSLKTVEEIKLYSKNILLEEHYILIQNVTDDSREKEFLKRKQLIEKYNSLLDKYCRHSNYKTILIKPAIFNFTKQEIPKHYESLLNLGPKFVPTNKNLPFMDIIISTESCALDMEHNHKENEAET